MRWDNLFDDLEAQLDRELAADELDVRVEDERMRLAQLRLNDRLTALRSDQVDPVVTAYLDSGAVVTVKIETLGRDWLAGLIVADGPSRRTILPVHALRSLAIEQGELERSIEQPGSSRVTERLGLAFVLRDLCRRRMPVTLAMGAVEIHGTLDRVARDHCDIAVHAPGTYRRARAVSQFRLVPFASLTSVTF